MSGEITRPSNIPGSQGFPGAEDRCVFACGRKALQEEQGSVVLLFTDHTVASRMFALVRRGHECSFYLNMPSRMIFD
jgi:hypothetical protein